MGDIFGESQAERTLRKAREQPAFPIGITGLVLVCTYGAYKYRHRGTMSTSIFLIQLRVAAQGTVIGCLCAGLAVAMAQKHLSRFLDKKEEEP